MLLISPTDHQDLLDTSATNLYFLVHGKVTVHDICAIYLR